MRPVSADIQQDAAASSAAPAKAAPARRWRAWALRLGGTAAILAGIFWVIPVAEVAGVVRNVHRGYLALGFAAVLFGIYLQAVHTWLPLRRIGMPITARGVFEINMITRFYGQFLPSELLAGAVKLHRLAAPTRQWGEVMAALAFTRVVDMLALIGLGIIFWLIEMPAGAGRWIGFAMLAMAAAMIAAHAAVLKPGLGRSLVDALPLSRLPWLQAVVVEKSRRIARTTVESYRVFGGATLPLAAISLLRHIVGIISFSLFAQSLGIQLSYLTIGWIRVVLYVVVMLPISVSGIGVREGSLVLLLQDYAVEPSEAVALAFLLFVTSLFAHTLGGVLELKNLLVRQGRRGAALTTDAAPGAGHGAERAAADGPAATGAGANGGFHAAAHAQPALLDRKLGDGDKSEVFLLRDGRILKLFRPDYAALADVEAELSRQLEAAGVSAPRLDEVIDVDGRPGLVLSNLAAGVTLSSLLHRQPWAIGPMARSLAELHAAVHDSTTTTLPSQSERIEREIASSTVLSGAVRRLALRRLSDLPEGDAVCHNDVHMRNVIASNGGIALIDWTLATRGNPLSDAAVAVLQLRFGEAPGHAVGRGMIDAGRNAFARAYLDRYLELRRCVAEDVSCWELPVAAALAGRRVGRMRLQLLERIAALTKGAAG